MEETASNIPTPGELVEELEEEPDESMAKFEEGMPNVNINNDNLRRSTRNKKHTKQYKPTMTGQQYENSLIQILKHICASQ